MSIKRVAIVGAGDLGRQLSHHLSGTPNMRCVGFFDDYADESGLIDNLPVLGNIGSIERLFVENFFDELLIAIGYKHLAFRGNLYLRLKGVVPFATYVHSSAIIDKTACIGPGSVIYAGCVIDMNVSVGDNCLLNLGCVISHDATLGHSSFLAPRVSIGGFSNIGDRVMLGIGTVVIDGLTVAPATRTGAGSVIVKHIEMPGLHCGVPAKLMK